MLLLKFQKQDSIKFPLQI